MSFSWICCLKIWATVLWSRSCVLCEGNYISHNLTVISVAQRSVWLCMALFCTVSSQNASRILCAWRALVNSLLNFSLLVPFLQKEAKSYKFTYPFETILRKLRPAQPSGRFKGHPWPRKRAAVEESFSALAEAGATRVGSRLYTYPPHGNYL